MGRKEIALDPNSVPAMLTVATTLAETTHETDLNWNDNYAEVMKDANQALALINGGQFTAPRPSRMASTTYVFPVSRPESKLGLATEG